jgi:hypothetical protein
MSQFFIDAQQTQMNIKQCGFSNEDLEASIRVLNSLSKSGNHNELFRHQTSNNFRGAFGRLLEAKGKGSFLIKNIKPDGRKGSWNIEELCCEMKIKKNKEKEVIIK